MAIAKRPLSGELVTIGLALIATAAISLMSLDVPLGTLFLSMLAIGALYLVMSAAAYVRAARQSFELSVFRRS